MGLGLQRTRAAAARRESKAATARRESKAAAARRESKAFFQIWARLKRERER